MRQLPCHGSNCSLCNECVCLHRHPVLLQQLLLRRAPRSASHQVLQSWWLSVWSKATLAADDNGTPLSTHYYLGIYFLFGAVSILFQMGRYGSLIYGALAAAKRLHSDLLRKACRLSVVCRLTLGTRLSHCQDEHDSLIVPLPFHLLAWVGDSLLTRCAGNHLKPASCRVTANEAYVDMLAGAATADVVL